MVEERKMREVVDKGSNGAGMGKLLGSKDGTNILESSVEKENTEDTKNLQESTINRVNIFEMVEEDATFFEKSTIIGRFLEKQFTRTKIREIGSKALARQPNNEFFTERFFYSRPRK